MGSELTGIIKRIFMAEESSEVKIKSFIGDFFKSKKQY